MRNKVKLSTIVQGQIPLFARESYPFLEEFLSSYFEYLESPGNPGDILTNLESYNKLDFVSNSFKSTTVSSDVDIDDDTINVESTLGFPKENGLLKINDEVIFYKSKDSTSFIDCTRGFSAAVNYSDPQNPDVLEFESTSSSIHSVGNEVSNLNAILLDEFFTKLKVQFAPGFENVELSENLNQALFIKHVKDFYNSKGTDSSFTILFKALYGATPKVFRPRDFLFTPSAADYRVTLDLTVEPIIGDPYQILNRVLQQDQDGDLQKAYGTVVGVKQIQKNGFDYYKISLDYGYNKDLSVEGTVFGEFSLHQQTRTLEKVSIGASVITVDSTIGFPDSGELLVYLESDDFEDDDDDIMLITYESINANQFLDVSGVNEEIPEGDYLSINSYVYSYDNEGEEVRMRITGVLSNLVEEDTVPYSKVGDSAQVWTLGKKSELLQANSWIFNHAISNRVFELVDEGNLNYTITTYDNCYVNSGDVVNINCDVRNYDGSLERIEKDFEVFAGPTPNNSFRLVNDRPIIEAYYVKRKTTKVKGSEIIANVQNTYIDTRDDVYVTSNSLPNYNNESLDLRYRSIVISGTFSGQTIVVQNHGLFTGDALFYDNSYSENNTLDLSGIYFAYRIDQDTFKLAKSRNNLEVENYVTLTGSTTYSKLVRLDYADDLGKEKKVLPQKLIKKITTDPQPRKYFYDIESNDRVGIFRNGVEIVTYKSNDYCYYGEIEEVSIPSGGEQYDIIDPPILELFDSNGSGFSGEVVVTGNLLSVDVLDGGFDYIGDANVIISGGNPSRPAKAGVEFKTVEHKEFFRSDSFGIDLVENTITFSSPHRFRDGDRVLYSEEGQTALGGLINSSYYYVGVISGTKIFLHQTLEDALSLINPIDFTSYGVGNHSLKSDSSKKVISSILVSDGGDGYSNNKAIVKSAGINTSNYTITSKNHKFKENDRVVYSYSDSPISGLTTSKTYLIGVVNEDSFLLFEENTNDGESAFKIKQEGKYVKISSTPDGYHTFSYPPLTITIDGKRGVGSKVEQDCLPTLNPIFRGSITKIEIKDSGSGYGSSEILNYQKQPRYYLKTGSNAIVKPVVFDGSIQKVVVLSGGENYHGSPNVYTFESDPEVNPIINAKLSPVIENGRLKEIKVINGGINHSDNVKIIIDSPANGGQLIFKIKSWNVNLIERIINEKNITLDDGIITKSINSNYELQYTHAYAPRKLRNTLFSEKFEEGITKYQTDLESDFSTPYHSPIIGWAYDGNPIYGPYAYDTRNGGRIRQMKSGYVRVDSTSRPNFPLGFFVEDYVFNDSGDLDEYNGRFCITPEFPKGTYAYFATFGADLQKEGQFSQNKLPQFPYIIGKSHYSQPVTFNENPTMDQNEFDFESFKCRRNVYPYNLKEWYSGYDYLIQPNKIDAHYATVKNIVPSTINEVQIIEAGDNYRAGDYVFFDNVGTGGTGLTATVKEIKGKTINSLVSYENYIPGVKLYKSNLTNGFISVCKEEHNLSDKTYVKITGISTSNNFSIDSRERVKLRFKNPLLNKNIDTPSVTGIVTYISVAEELFSPLIDENDILKIGDEKLKVLNVDNESLRIRVIRNYDSTVGTSHSQGDTINVLQRKFFIDNFDLTGVPIGRYDREYYFDPIESVGIGVTHGLGITTNIYFSNPGTGVTQLSIPTRAIYLKNHQLETGDQVTYRTNFGSPLVVSTTGIGTTTLDNESKLYVVKYDNNTIGLSTVRLGISSISDNLEFVGVGTDVDANPLYFVGVGTGLYHSLVTNYDHISCEVFQNTISVNLSENSGLQVSDSIRLNIFPKSTETYKVYYNDQNRRLLVNRKQIQNVNIDENQIYIEDHGFVDGDKVIYTSSNPYGGLVQDGIYYTVYINKDTIELCEYFVDVQNENGNRINLTNDSGDGYLYKVNPLLTPIRNNTIKFDLSDPSLSYVDGTVRLPAFEFKLFKDSNLTEEYITDEQTTNFNVVRSGLIGIDESANLTLNVTDFTPVELYYALIPVKTSGLSKVKSELILDNSVKDYCKIQNTFIGINGSSHNVVSTSSTNFTFNTTSELPKVSYATTEAILNYYTNSTNASGPIEEIQVQSQGSGYNSIVGICTVISSTGSGARVKARGDSVGTLKEFAIEDCGWDYPTDPTLHPTAKLPTVFEVDQLFSFDTIKVTSPGLNYTVFPNLIVKDSTTSEVLSDLIISYTKSGVTVVQNTFKLSNDSPEFIPTNNSNGYSIKNIVFDFTTKNVVLTFKTSFSDPDRFPFVVGDKILIEGCASKTTGSKNRSFNSSDFSYTLYTITEIDPNIGGSNGTITFNLTGIVDSSETLGEYDEVSATGIVVLQKHFPTFESTIKRSSYIPGENIRGLTSDSIGEVQSWDSKGEILKIFSPYKFSVDELIKGEKSGTVSRIYQIYESEMRFEIDSSARVVKGWNDQKGFLSDNNQIVQDSFYWQKFSYAIQSNVSENVWEDNVDSLNHLSGWKRFSDYTINSIDLINVGIATEQNSGDFVSIASFISEIDMNCVYDFDIVLDETDLIGSRRISNGLVFNSRDLQDYDKSIGNRVLIIDDISDQFNNIPRPDPFSIVTTFKLSEIRSKKLLIFARDKRFTAERQLYLVTMIHNGSSGYINQYGRVETVENMGSFDISVFEDEGNILFYPTKFRVNDFDLSFITYDVKDYISGVGNTTFGNIVDVQSSFVERTSGIGSTTIVSIPLEYRASKLLVQIEDSQNVFEYDEITVLHDGTNVEIIDYGQITTDSLGIGASSGIGTYYAYISGSNLNIDLIPDYPYDADINTLRVSIASSDSGYTETRAEDLNTTRLESHYVGIGTSTSTSATKIAEFENGVLNYSGGYLLISVEDLTNQRYQVSEMVVTTDDAEAYYSEFGQLYNDGEVGIITAGVNGSYTEVYFTADSEIDAEVRVFANYIGLVDTFNPYNEISLINSRLFTGYGEYEGTERAIKREFELYHKGSPIFEKQFDGESESIVKIEENLIELPQHYFVTGEKVFYTYDSLNEPIGIATTTISGIGLTDKLPNELYIIKEDDLNVRFAATVENALRLVPEPLELLSVGFGSAHYITAQKQNVKSLVTIDNMIQSPIVSTAITSGLSTSILTTDDIITVTNDVEFFFSGDFIKINDEIMRVSIVGYGGSANDIYVQRPWMGTELQTHGQFDLITKVVGNYNINRNTISFADPPYGKYPIGSPDNRPDERDYTGITTHSTFSGRTFMRSGIVDTGIEPYTKNYVFDGIQESFTGFTSSFTLTVEGEDVTGVSDSNAIITVKDIFQSPRILGDSVTIPGNYYLEEDEILGTTKIYFEETEYRDGDDVLARGIPVGGRIVSVGSTKGFGYQPLVSAGGTAIVSAGGTIESIIVTNVGSGYRSGIQTVYVGVQTSSTDSSGITTCIGLASINNGRVDSVSIINPGSGYTHTNPPVVVFDAPLSYSNIDLEYATTSIGRTTGVNAKVDIVVGQGSSVIDFNFTNIGNGYEINNVLTVAVGGTTGIPREYRGRYVDAGNLIAVNKEFIQNEAVGFVTTAYPSLLSNPDYDETVCKRDVGYIVDAISKDLAFGGNYYSVQSGLAYWDSGSSYVDGESTETIAAYEYIVGISSYIINNITVPTSYQPSISSVTQIKDVSIDFDDTCSPSAYSSDCCSDVFSAISNYVGIITTIIGLGTASAPTIQSPTSQPTLTLPTTQYFEQFEVTVTDTNNDEFTGWTIGDLQVIDDISDLFNGESTRFPLKFDGVRKSIKAATGSLIDVQSTLLVFMNDILQVPGQGYLFKGGSVIRFPEAPKLGDKCKILFYKGTGDVDVELVDILETIKAGDVVTVHSDIAIQDQEERSVKDITSTDSLETFPYGGPGILADPFVERPVNWCRQSSDIIVDGTFITKERDLYEAAIHPLTNLIYDVGVGSTIIYVEGVKTFFDNKKENAEVKYNNIIDIVTQDEISEALAVASVNSSGIVTSIAMLDFGSGYSEAPSVTISNPVGGGTTALATAYLSAGRVTSIVVDSGGSNYSQSSPPNVLISPPTPKSEVAFKVNYEGDFGLITGIGTTTVGVSSLGLVFEFTIPEDSPLKDLSIVEESFTYSGIGTGDFFVIKETNLGYGITTIEMDGSTLVSGNDYINNVYQVHDLITDVPYTVLVDDFIASLTRYGSFSVGLGLSTTVAIGATLIIEDHTKVVTVVEDYNNLGITSFLTRSFFGEYSYGKITNVTRPYPEDYTIYRDNGLIGISTSPIVRRTNALRYQNYLT